MSKKSRRRNKKILATLAALGGAAMLANRRRDNSIAANEAKEAGFGTEKDFKETIVTTPKVYQDSIMRGGTGVNAAKQPLRFGQVIDKEGVKKTIRPFESAGLKLGVSNRKKNMDTYKGYATRTGNSRGDLGLTGRPEKKDYFGATIFPKSQAADNFKADLREYGRGNQYKSGGKVTKRKGAAKRGFGRAFKGGK